MVRSGRIGELGLSRENAVSRAGRVRENQGVARDEQAVIEYPGRRAKRVDR
jgi:hypothetical protein